MVLLSACAKDEQPVNQPEQTAESAPVGDVAQGEALFNEPLNGGVACSNCHSLTDSVLVGPGLGGYGARMSEREDAEDYTRESILQPSARIAAGFSDWMPKNYAELLSEGQVDNLVAFLLAQ